MLTVRIEHVLRSYNVQEGSLKTHKAGGGWDMVDYT